MKTSKKEHGVDKKYDLKKQPFIEVKVKAYRMHDKKTGKGVLFFKCFCTDVNIDGERVGEIGGGTGATILYDKRRQCGEDSFAIVHDDLWNSFQEALSESS